MAKVKKLKMKQADGNLSDYINLGANASDIDMADGKNLQETLDNFETLPAGGTTGQILTKKSATDGDAEWQTIETGKEEIAIAETAPTEQDIELWIDLSEDYDANTGGGNATQVEVIDTLDSTSTTAALSANQGKVLNEKINSISSSGSTGSSFNDKFLVVTGSALINNGYAGGTADSSPYTIKVTIPMESGFSASNSQILSVMRYTEGDEINKTLCNNDKYDISLDYTFKNGAIEENYVNIIYNWTGDVSSGARAGFYFDVVLMKTSE